MNVASAFSPYALHSLNSLLLSITNKKVGNCNTDRRTYFKQQFEVTVRKYIYKQTA